VRAYDATPVMGESAWHAVQTAEAWIVRSRADEDAQRTTSPALR